MDLDLAKQIQALEVRAEVVLVLVGTLHALLDLARRHRPRGLVDLTLGLLARLGVLVFVGVFAGLDLVARDVAERPPPVEIPLGRRPVAEQEDRVAAPVEGVGVHVLVVGLDQAARRELEAEAQGGVEVGHAAQGPVLARGRGPPSLDLVELGQGRH